MQKITPYLWFDTEAEEAANLYVSAVKDSRITGVTYFTAASAETSGKSEGSVMTVAFELNGQKFVAFNGCTQFSFTPALSLQISCEDQAEVDYLWEELSSGGGSKSQCGWLTDRYGVSWQIVPVGLQELLSSDNPEGKKRVMAELMKMTKIDIALLREAHG